jgi:hypothetical protein
MHVIRLSHVRFELRESYLHSHKEVFSTNPDTKMRSLGAAPLGQSHLPKRSAIALYQTTGSYDFAELITSSTK